MLIAYSCGYSFRRHVFDALEVVVEARNIVALAWSAKKSPVCAYTYSVGTSIQLILCIKSRLSLISIDWWRGLRLLGFPPMLPQAGSYGMYVSCICITIIHTFKVRLVFVIPALNYHNATCTYSPPWSLNVVIPVIPALFLWYLHVCIPVLPALIDLSNKSKIF